MSELICVGVRPAASTIALPITVGPVLAIFSPPRGRMIILACSLGMGGIRDALMILLLSLFPLSCVLNKAPALGLFSHMPQPGRLAESTLADIRFETADCHPNSGENSSGGRSSPSTVICIVTDISESLL